MINNSIKVIPVGDAFSPDDLKKEPYFQNPRIIDGSEEFGPITRWVIEQIPREIKEKNRGKLAIRLDRFNLTEGALPQAPHFDRMNDDWLLNRVQLVLALGQGTGLTDVYDPFDHKTPTTWSEAKRIAKDIEEGKIRVGKSSYPSGNLIMSDSPFVHNRGQSFAGLRFAYDIGLYYPQLEQKWVFEGE